MLSISIFDRMIILGFKPPALSFRPPTFSTTSLPRLLLPLPPPSLLPTADAAEIRRRETQPRTDSTYDKKKIRTFPGSKSKSQKSRRAFKRSLTEEAETEKIVQKDFF